MGDRLDLEGIRARLAACPELRPYVTGKGGVVILNGPFAMPKAEAAAEFISHALADLRALLAVAEPPHRPHMVLVSGLGYVPATIEDAVELARLEGEGD